MVVLVFTAANNLRLERVDNVDVAGEATVLRYYPTGGMRACNQEERDGTIHTASTGARQGHGQASIERKGKGKRPIVSADDASISTTLQTTTLSRHKSTVLYQN